MLPFEFIVEGTPVSQQTRRRQRLRAWMAQVEQEARRSWPDAAPPATGPVMVSLTYLYRVTAVDLDNLAKPILEALRGLAYRDDEQVTDIHLRKRNLDDDIRVTDPASILVAGIARRRLHSRCCRGRAGPGGAGVMRLTETVDLDARLREIAEEYRAKGYNVVLDPQRDQLPDAVARHRPALLARKGNEAVVVEVTTRARLTDQPRLNALAKAVRARPGWRFELVIVGQRGRDLIAEGAQEWDEDDVARGLAEVDALLKAGHTAAALLLAWAAAEATLRLLAARAEIELQRDDPPYLLKRLATSAEITRQEHDVLWEALRLRNAVAHGLKPVHLDPAQVRQPAEMTSRLLQAGEIPAGEAV